MDTLETILIWGSVYAYTVATILLLTAFVFKKEKLLVWAGWFILPAFAGHTGEFALRWIRTGYFPGSGDFENVLVQSWFIMAFTVYLYFKRKRPIRGLALVSVPVALVFLGYGLMRNPVQLPLAVSLKSSWLVIHVLFAQLAFGAFAIACGLGIVYLLKEGKEKKGLKSAFYERFPDLPVIEETMFKFVIYGFIPMAIQIAAGSIWAKELWGKYWNWDPVEIWSLTTWLIYGVAIHLRVTLGWKGKKLAWLLILAMVAVFITFWGVDLMVEKSHQTFGVDSSTDFKQMMGK